MGVYEVIVRCWLCCAVHNFHRLIPARSVCYKLTAGPFCPVGAPVGGQPRRGGRARQCGELPADIRLTAAGVGMTDRPGADGAVPPLVLEASCTRPRRGSPGVGDSLPVDVFLLGELRSQRIHAFVINQFQGVTAGFGSAAVRLHKCTALSVAELVNIFTCGNKRQNNSDTGFET